MKRSIETKEIRVLFFTAYFLYGRNKYGTPTEGKTDACLAGIAACRGVMRLSREWLHMPSPLPRPRLEEAFAHLRHQAASLADGPFKHAYLEMLATLRETIS